MERNLRKTRTGKVVSNKMDKTIVVAVTDNVKHPLIGKIVKKTYKLYAQDDENTCNIGDTVRVDVRIKEGSRERIQAFEGTIIAKRGSGVSETFTVRRVSYGVGVERVFPVNSPNVTKVTVVRSGKVRRAKLYYLRDRVGKAAKVKGTV